MDYLQLEIPKLYGAVIDGMKSGTVLQPDGTIIPFDMNYVLDEICLPMIMVIVALICGTSCVAPSGIRTDWTVAEALWMLEDR